MKKLSITLAFLPMIFSFFCCQQLVLEQTTNFFEGKFVSIKDGNIWIRDLDWSNPRQITSDAKYKKPPSGLNYYHTYYDKPLWSSNGEQIICIKNSVGSGAYVSIMDTNGINKKNVLQLDDVILAMDWSNDGEWIAYSTITDRSIHIVSLDGLEHKNLNKNGKHQIKHISWSDDSKKIVVCNYIHDLFMLDIISGEKSMLPNCSGIYSKPFWSPDGEFIVYSKFNHPIGQIVILNVYDTSEEIIKEGQGVFHVLGWTPNGEYTIYLAGTDFTLQALQVSTGANVDLNYKYRNSADAPRGDLFIYD